MAHRVLVKRSGVESGVGWSGVEWGSGLRLRYQILTHKHRHLPRPDRHAERDRKVEDKKKGGWIDGCVLSGRPANTSTHRQADGTLHPSACLPAGPAGLASSLLSSADPSLSCSPGPALSRLSLLTHSQTAVTSGSIIALDIKVSYVNVQCIEQDTLVSVL